MKTIVPMFVVMAALLLASSPAQAGYTDGMSQYAAYHVMQGRVDPSGMKMTTKRLDQQKVENSREGFELLEASLNVTYSDDVKEIPIAGQAAQN